MKIAIYIMSLIILYLGMIIYNSAKWAINNFSFESFDEIIYTITSPLAGTGNNMILTFFKENFIIPLIIIIGIIIIHYIFKKFSLNVKIVAFGKKIYFDLFYLKIYKFLYLIPIFIFVYSFRYFGKNLYFFDYLKYQFQESSFIEDNYVFPKKVKMTFPDKKRNLIYIYLESMESTYMDIKNGGGYEVNYIPQLTKIANNNISFSNTDAFGGAYTAGATGWTIGAMVAHSSGLPLKSPFSGNLLYNYYEQILPGAYTLGEILHDNGYNNYIMFGSDATFAGRDIYYKNHGQYKIYDYYTAIEDGVIDDDYFVFWGYEDEKLFSYAKRELKKISKNKEPFNFTLLTVDTHAMDGYTSDFCKNEYDNKYLNSIACSSYQVNNFISWIKKQDFYKDTTIVLVGDHLSMNNYSFNNLPAHYNRTVYNAFINTNVKPINEKERIFSTMDFFPTTLASLGVYIDGDRLGLGTNLFSDKHTLLEEYNYSYVNTELNKNSRFYDNCFINKDC